MSGNGLGQKMRSPNYGRQGAEAALQSARQTQDAEGGQEAIRLHDRPACDLKPRCIEPGTEEKLTVYCLEGAWVRVLKSSIRGGKFQCTGKKCGKFELYSFHILQEFVHLGSYDSSPVFRFRKCFDSKGSRTRSIPELSPYHCQ